MADVWTRVAAELASLLEPDGFRRSGLIFVDRNDGDVIREVKIAKFRWNTPGQQRFQIILSIYLASGQDGEFAFKHRNAKYSLVFQRSAGYLWGDEAFLFVVPPVLPDQAFSDELRRHVAHDILPFLRRCTDVDAVIQVLGEENRKLGRNLFSAPLAVALARLGRTEESREYFRQSLGDPESIRRVAERYGIHLEG